MDSYPTLTRSHGTRGGEGNPLNPFSELDERFIYKPGQETVLRK